MKAAPLFTEGTPTAVLVRRVRGAIAQSKKASLVAKVAASHKRRREASGKCEGRKTHAELRADAVVLARRLRRRKPKMSLRATSGELAAREYVNERRPFAAKSAAAMMVGAP
jgi:hypothetical protein